MFFTIAFISLWVGIIQILSYARGTVTNIRYDIVDNTLLKVKNYPSNYSLLSGQEQSYHIPYIIERIPWLRDLFYRYMGYIHSGQGFDVSPMMDENMRLVLDHGSAQVVYQDPLNLYTGVLFLLLFFIMLCVSIWRLWENKTQKV